MCNKPMKKIIIYLLVLLGLVPAFILLFYYKAIDLKSDLILLGCYCALFGLLGGVINCLRSIYLHVSVFNDWDESWAVWYFLRPIISSVMGLISFVFIEAGLLVFTAQGTNYSNSSAMAYFAFSFLAGYNVQNFLRKIEEVSKSLLGVKPIGYINKKEQKDELD